jgi:hypothetical protein
MKCRVDVGLLILVFAFTVSLWSGLFIGYSDLYSDYIRYVFLFQILPPAVGLAFSVIAFISEIKHPTGIIDKFWLPLIVSGGLFFLWGAFGLLWTWSSYFRTEEEYMWNPWMPSTYVPAGVRELTLERIEIVSLGFVIWLIVGGLFVFSLMFSRMSKEWEFRF